MSNQSPEEKAKELVEGAKREVDNEVDDIVGTFEFDHEKGTETYKRNENFGKPVERVYCLTRKQIEGIWDAGADRLYAAHFGTVPNPYPDKETYLKSLNIGE